MLSDSAELPHQNRVTGRLQKNGPNLKSGQIICQAIKCLKESKWKLNSRIQHEHIKPHLKTFEILKWLHYPKVAEDKGISEMKSKQQRPCSNCMHWHVTSIEIRLECRCLQKYFHI